MCEFVSGQFSMEQGSGGGRLNLKIAAGLRDLGDVFFNFAG